MKLSNIYFIQAQPSGLVKIGVSDSPQIRLRQIQRTHAESLTLLSFMPAPAFVEQSAHRRFSADRVTGEWFKPTTEIIALARVKEPLPFLRAILGDEIEADSLVARVMAAEIEEGARIEARHRARQHVGLYWTRDAVAYWGEWADLHRMAR